MAVASIRVSETPLVLYTLRRADDALILGHRLSEWCGHAPMLEEDMALANMGLDLLGQARELYSYAAKVEGKGNDEDKFAYLRDVRQYRNLLLLEQPNGDFAHTMVRQFFYAAFAEYDGRNLCWLFEKIENLRRLRCAPSPLVGEGWGEGFRSLDRP